MATPKPGEIRCPTCHRSTPPAAFCTQCGSAIPADARARPRGMDRDELQDRIRARRSGDPYRRGGPADDEQSPYSRYEPEPEDARARPLRGAPDARRDHFVEREEPTDARADVTPEEPARRDLTRDDEEDRWAAPPPAVVPPPPEPAAGPTATYEGAEAPTYVDNFDDDAYSDDEYAYEYDEWEERDRRGSGAGAFAILGFLALGVLALIGGAMLAGIFNGDPGVGQNGDPTLTPVPTAAAMAPAETIEPTEQASPDESPENGSATPAPGEPVEFSDGFVAEVQPCIPGSAGTNGCDSNGASNSGSVWAWVGFRNGTENDVIGAELIGPDGNTLSEGSIDLARIGCRPNCPGGWTYFPYSGLESGEYTVEITRNGEPAGSTRFEVS